MRYALTMIVTMSIFVALFTHVTNAQEHSEETHSPMTETGVIKGAAFPIVAFVRESRMSFPQPSDRVCPMFDPRTRPDLLGIHRIETLYEPEDGTLKGLTLRMGMRPGARAHGHELAADRFSTTIVIHHDVEVGVLKFLNIYGNIEDEQITITCKSEQTGGTVATYQNRILGFHDYGVEAVTNYVEARGVEESALQWRDAIMQALNEGSN